MATTINVKKTAEGNVIVSRFDKNKKYVCYVIWNVRPKLEDITYYTTLKAAKAYIAKRKKEGTKAKDLVLYKIK